MIDFSIVIVSYNTADLIGECLASAFASEDCEKEIFVVDNASTDDSADVVRRQFPGVHLVANVENRGFAAANNQVLPLCRGRYLLFLNPDTVLPPLSLKTLGDFLERNPRVGLAGARIVNPDGTDQESVSRRYPGEKFAVGELTGLPGRIACVLGAAMAARAEIIRAVNGFDESFFLYGEDEDLCLRIRKAGYEIGYAEKRRCDARRGAERKAISDSRAMEEESAGGISLLSENITARKPSPASDEPTS